MDKDTSKADNLAFTFTESIMLSGAGSKIAKETHFWHAEINETINQIANQQELLGRCIQKLKDLPQQIKKDKKQYENLCNADYPLQYSYAQNYLEIKKQLGKNLISKLRFLVQLSDYLEIHCDKYHHKFNLYQNLISTQIAESIFDLAEEDLAKSLSLIKLYNKKIPDLIARQTNSLIVLSKNNKPYNNKNYDLADAYIVADQTYQYIVLLMEDYKRVTQTLLQILQVIDRYLDESQLEQNKSKFASLASFKLEIPKVMLQFLTQASLGKIGLTWFNQHRRENRGVGPEQPTKNSTPFLTNSP